MATIPQRQSPDPKKQQASPQRPPANPHLETQALLRTLISKMSPVAALANQATDPDQPDPIDIMIRLLRKLTGGTDQILQRLEGLEARLDGAMPPTTPV